MCIYSIYVLTMLLKIVGKCVLVIMLLKIVLRKCVWFVAAIADLMETKDCDVAGRLCNAPRRS